jgi:hypothetical protein
VARDELLQMFKILTVKVKELFTVSEKCVTNAHQSVCTAVLVLG